MKIIERQQSQIIFNYFDSHKYCGLIAAKEYIVNGNIKDENSTNTNSEKIIEITERYKIAPPSHQFVAGTMFWVRARPFEDFFTKNDPLEIRKSLEDGNVLDNFSGTFTHSWERLFSWIVTSGGYKIHGI
jgi:lipopolysaccharide biosynthesis protein